MRINTNINAMTALNQSTKNTALAGNSMAKLSSGLRINNAGDDAAGLAISEKMRAQIRGMEQAERNTQDGISLAQTAEGAMEETQNIVQRMRELSVQSSNETNTAEDRTKIAEELTQLHDEINRIANSTEFNKISLLNGQRSTGTKETINLTEVNTDKFQITSDLKKFGLGDGKEISIETVAGTGTLANDTKIVVKVDNKEYTLDHVESDGTNAGSIGVKGKYTLKASDGDTLDLDIKETTVAATASTKLVSAALTREEILGSDITLQVGANNTESQKIRVNIQNTTTKSLGLGEDAETLITGMKTAGTEGTVAATNMINKIDNALEILNTGRANLGAMQNRLETASSNLTTSSENLTAAESRIRDVDVAKEMMNLSKLNLLNQASQAMMTQAKSQPEGVMQLLR